ncbi:DUF2062 domain-containing protein [Chengkuizengella axinellae]|uniref:DUF2062 domain-containing protein n=1 Tax=Chengkuizengella axinellae TaxID=3064388 RepID=A0ABT9ITD0_9BACL|nr:DUF2062 domain-containing protein [Chengkuizengella sp. 2205SS18-9]MDP5272600.1 DUF2062 domain-containing protein [Chengkuizengella sp. 2205SS18-9]
MNKGLRIIRYYFIRLFRLKSGTSKISLGFSLGFIPCWFPTFGIGIMISIALAKLFKVNIVSSMIAASLGAFVWPVLFFLDYQTGTLIFSSSLKDAGSSFVVGAILNSFIFMLISYVVFYNIFKKYRLFLLDKLRSKTKTIRNITKVNVARSPKKTKETM